MMIVVRVLALVAVGLPLAGCLGVTLPPKPLPEWAMSPQAEPVATPRMKAARNTSPRRAPERTLNASSTGGAYVGPARAASDDVKPFTPEWLAREEASNNKTRQIMNICRNC